MCARQEFELCLVWIAEVSHKTHIGVANEDNKHLN